MTLNEEQLMRSVGWALTWPELFTMVISLSANVQILPDLELVAALAFVSVHVLK